MRFSFYALAVLAFAVVAGAQAASSDLNERGSSPTDPPSLNERDVATGGVALGFSGDPTTTGKPTDKTPSLTISDAASTPLPTQLHYYHGPILWKPVRLYYILYGNHWNKSQEELIVYFSNCISNTTWWNLVKLPDFHDHLAGSGGLVVKKVVYCSGSCARPRITRPSIASVVISQLQAGQLPVDRNGIYIVLTSPDVIATDSCHNPKGSCGFHDHTSYKSTPIVYGWIANWHGTGCTIGCLTRNRVYSPNNDVGIDGLINVLAHEFAEAVTNPYYNAWEGAPNANWENGDFCAWK
ncbi:phosphate-induced protein 1 conserved region-domain-containing protein [Jimgerdemannia flammicorona]|uniref:Phosphate-induced protein 1 conserved region-domain-containing protein n=1 Tax=Jimgerdemannia flammicorona TaxID=994334 RepID=A0A433QM57_9FUNG|nr:phosphate-induced protein 1 conserved region-domain-containing protein [Jimgerdemannia flammicorona]